MLDDERLDSLVRTFTNRIDNQVVLAAFAAQRHCQHRMNIWVGSKSCQGIHSQLLICIDLRATVLVMERNASLDRTSNALGRIGCADACWQDQDVVTNAHATVAATIAHKGAGARHGSRRTRRLVLHIGVNIDRVF